MLPSSPAETRALATGEIIVAFAERATVSEGDELELTSGPSIPEAHLKPAYRRWASVPHLAGLTAVAVAVVPTTILDPLAGAARHIRMSAPDGDLVVLRVFNDDGPVLSDEAFAARRLSVEGALTP